MDQEDAASDRHVVTFPDQAHPVLAHPHDHLFDLVDACELSHRRLPCDPSRIIDQGLPLRLEDATQGGRSASAEGVPSGCSVKAGQPPRLLGRACPGFGWAEVLIHLLVAHPVQGDSIAGKAGEPSPVGVGSQPSQEVDTGRIRMAIALQHPPLEHQAANIVGMHGASVEAEEDLPSLILTVTDQHGPRRGSGHPSSDLGENHIWCLQRRSVPAVRSPFAFHTDVQIEVRRLAVEDCRAVVR